MAAKASFTTDTEMKSDHSFDVYSNGNVQAGTTEKPTAATGLKYWVKRLAVETGGIERVTDEDRAQNTSKVWNACTFW
jgi:hypothetical protein